MDRFQVLMMPLKRHAVLLLKQKLNCNNGVVFIFLSITTEIGASCKFQVD